MEKLMSEAIIARLSFNYDAANERFCSGYAMATLVTFDGTNYRIYNNLTNEESTTNKVMEVIRTLCGR